VLVNKDADRLILHISPITVNQSGEIHATRRPLCQPSIIKWTYN